MSEKKLNLNIAKMYAMDAAFQTMDFYDKDGNRTFYELGELRLDIAKNRNRIKNSLDAFEKARVALIRECSNGADEIKPEHANWPKFRETIEKMNESEEEINLITIPRVKLKLDVNPFSIMALAALEAIIED